jgi:hypothetical protein
MSRREFVRAAGIVTSAPVIAQAEQSPPASNQNQLVVSIPHSLSRTEALRRVKAGLVTLQREYTYLFTIQDEKWNGYHLSFHAGVLGQPADGTIDVASGYVYLTVTLPWLLAILARAAEPLIVKEGTAMLQRK